MKSNDLIGKNIPSVTFKTRQKNEAGDFEWVDVSTESIFLGKKIVLFALPGAFTPTCSSTHLPGYELKYSELKSTGVDEVYCLSVNDTFVMNAWGKEIGANNVKLLPDGSTLFTKELGMLVKKDNLGFGERSWRYSILVEDGKITQAFVEDGFGDNSEEDPFVVSDADTMLAHLKSNS